MLFRLADLEAIRAGRVDLAFRRWKRPRVRPGSRLRTAVGLVEVLDVRVVSLASIDAGELERAGLRSRAELDRLLARRDGKVHRVELRFAGPDPRVALREHDRLDDAERGELEARLERLDRASRRGPWTRTVLELIAARPEVRAPDLAAGLGLETQVFKRDVRKLKELGLTESLEVGYRLSPRGRALMSARSDPPRSP